MGPISYADDTDEVQGLFDPSEADNQNLTCEVPRCLSYSIIKFAMCLMPGWIAAETDV